MWIPTLLWNAWEMVTGVVGYPDEGYYDMLDSGALVYPHEGGRYRAECCMALE
jgi:hypothetical protein